MELTTLSIEFVFIGQLVLGHWSLIDEQTPANSRELRHMPKPLNIGMIGYGSWGRAHQQRYAKVNHFFDCLIGRCSRRFRSRCGQKAKEVPRRSGAYESVETDWKKLLERKDYRRRRYLHSNNLHKEIAIASRQGGQDHSLRGSRGHEHGRRVRDVPGGRKRPVWPTSYGYYRRIPAVTFAKQIIDSGKLGRIFHYRANFLQDWTISADLPQGGAGLWRLDARPPARESPAICWLLHRYGDLAQRRHLKRHRDDGDIRQGAHAYGHGQKAGSKDRRRLRVSLPPSPMARGIVRVDPLRPRSQALCTRWKSTARRLA